MLNRPLTPKEISMAKTKASEEKIIRLLIPAIGIATGTFMVYMLIAISKIGA